MGQYEQIAEKIKGADGILIGASNGLSIAEGYNIFANDERFRSHFSDFQRKYGIHSMIQGSFGGFETENEMWSYYSRMAYYYMYHTQSSPHPDADLICVGKGETAFCGDFQHGRSLCNGRI